MKVGTPVQGDLWDCLCSELGSTTSRRKRSEWPFLLYSLRSIRWSF